MNELALRKAVDTGDLGGIADGVTALEQYRLTVVVEGEGTCNLVAPLVCDEKDLNNK